MGEERRARAESVLEERRSRSGVHHARERGRTGTGVRREDAPDHVDGLEAIESSLAADRRRAILRALTEFLPTVALLIFCARVADVARRERVAAVLRARGRREEEREERDDDARERARRGEIHARKLRSRRQRERASARARVERIARAEDRIAKNVPRCRGWWCGQVSGAFDDVTSTRRHNETRACRMTFDVTRRATFREDILFQIYQTKNSSARITSVVLYYS